MTSDFFSSAKPTTPHHGPTRVSTFSKFKEDSGTVRETVQLVRPVLAGPKANHQRPEKDGRRGPILKVVPLLQHAWTHNHTEQ